MKADRSDWNEYFMSMAELISSRSTCLRRKVGAVIVKNNHILSTGYNGAATKMPHCEDVGCIRKKLNIPSGERHELCVAVHAEQNAIIQAAKYGISIENADIYCTHMPCLICAKMLINAGIKRIFFKEKYNDKSTVDFILKSNIELIQIKQKETKWLN